MLSNRLNAKDTLTVTELVRNLQLTRALEIEILDRAQLHFSTVGNAADSRLSKFEYETLLVDEATQIIEMRHDHYLTYFLQPSFSFSLG